MALTRGNFASLIEPGLRKYFSEEFDGFPSMLKSFYSFLPHRGLPYQKFAGIIDLPVASEFTGTVEYMDTYENSATQLEYKEYAPGIQIQWKLIQDAMHFSIENKARGLAKSIAERRERDGARRLNYANATTDDEGTSTSIYDGGALCANAHSSIVPNSTLSQDNLYTLEVSHDNVITNRELMRKYKSDNGILAGIMPDLLLGHPDKADDFFEITRSQLRSDNADNASNYNKGFRYDVWDHLDLDTDNWFLIDSKRMKRAMVWIDRVAPKFFKMRDFDTFVAKYSAYTRYTYGVVGDWRWISMSVPA